MDDGRWRIGTKTHTLEALRKAEELLGVKELGTEATPMRSDYIPEMDESPFLGVEQHHHYKLSRILFSDPTSLRRQAY